MRLALVCQEVALAQRGLDLPPGSAERLVAIVALRAINGWSLQEVQEHWDAGSRQRGLLEEEAWGVLPRHGVQTWEMKEGACCATAPTQQLCSQRQRPLVWGNRLINSFGPCREIISISFSPNAEPTLRRAPNAR